MQHTNDRPQVTDHDPAAARPATPTDTATRLRDWLARRVEVSVPGWAIATAVVVLLLVALD